MLWLGIDVGGTFTDLVIYDTATNRISLGKVPSTPDDQSRGILDGLAAIDVDPAALDTIGHGSTVATNTALERNGADMAALVTEGHRDILITGRGNRTLMYNIKATAPEPIVPRDRCYQIPERLDVHGDEVVALDEDTVVDIATELAQRNTEAVAVCYLHSYAQPRHEQRTAEILRRILPDAVVTTSSEILPEYREHERFSTTALSAYVAPRMRRYLSNLRSRLQERGCRAGVSIMTSSGGTLPDHQVEKRPVLSMLSGPAAGVIAAQFVGRRTGYPNIITCDMGGTSTDVCLIRDSAYPMTGAGKVGAFALKAQQVDINTVGAGGGSIASYAAGQLLKVGPRSAGAVPGPACYGRGGQEPTVTDSNVVLGRLGSAEQSHGGLTLDHDRAAAAVSRLAGEVGLAPDAMAEGIVRIAVVNMTAAIKEISVMRGLDPRDFCLMAYGGAGPLHATAIANELGISTVLSPPMPANFSAFGLLVADVKRDLVRTRVSATSSTSLADIQRMFDELIAAGRRELADAGFSEANHRLVPSLDMRYLGQAFELAVPVDLDGLSLERIDADFRSIYKARYGSAPDGGSEIVSYRLAAWGLTKKPVLSSPTNGARTATPEVAATRQVTFDQRACETKVYLRENLPIDVSVAGPAIVEETSTATVIPPGWSARLTPHDCLQVEHRQR